jgi:hypothetical protein
MSSWRTRVAICVTVAALDIGVGELDPVAHAADCAIPEFLAIGKVYAFITDTAKDTVTVIAIDSQSCWVKVSGKAAPLAWVNLRQVLAIEERPKPLAPPPAPVKPGKRR